MKWRFREAGTIYASEFQPTKISFKCLESDNMRNVQLPCKIDSAFQILEQRVFPWCCCGPLATILRYLQYICGNKVGGWIDVMEVPFSFRTSCFPFSQVSGKLFPGFSLSRQLKSLLYAFFLPRENRPPLRSSLLAISSPRAAQSISQTPRHVPFQ